MNHLEAALVARSFRDGRALRTALLRHRRFVDKPLTLVLWQLGAEPFSAAAIGFGEDRMDLRFVVAGEPRNRDLAFGALLHLAEWFNPRFEAPSFDREIILRGEFQCERTRQAPQILVANEATVEMIGRLGRRLAYLSTAGGFVPPPALIRLGQHFQFIARRAGVPGQQLIVAMTDLLKRHYADAQSPFERFSLAALDAFIEPPPGAHGFWAATANESDVVGPAPSGNDDTDLEPLVEEFNQRRAGATDPATVAPLMRPIEDHFRPLVQRTWQLLWRCRDREARVDEAASVGRRWDEDRESYTQHMDWVQRDGRRRTRQTPRQAAMLLRQIEEAKALVDAEEACDDPIRMIPYLLDQKAVRGRVLDLNVNHQEMGVKRRVRRPLVTIESKEPCRMPRGKEIWWTRNADGPPYLLHEVRPSRAGGSLVTLKHTTGRTQLPSVGEVACFSICTTKPRWLPRLPTADPWTHRPALPPPPPAPIEEV